VNTKNIRILKLCLDDLKNLKQNLKRCLKMWIELNIIEKTEIKNEKINTSKIVKKKKTEKKNWNQPEGVVNHPWNCLEVAEPPLGYYYFLFELG